MLRRTKPRRKHEDRSSPASAPIVAGGSRGHRARHRARLCRSGAAVSICARGAETLSATREEIARFGGTAHAAVCDLSDEAAIPRYIEDAAGSARRHRHSRQQRLGFRHHRRRGRLGGQRLGRSVGDGAGDAARHCPISKNPTSGSILNISSISGFRASVRTPPYAAVKAAVLRIHPDPGRGLRPQGDPGQLHRPRLDRVSRRHLGAGQGEQPDLYGRILRSIPFGRLGRPEEMAQVALFLCSPLASWVTGQNIAVDGGQML